MNTLLSFTPEPFDDSPEPHGEYDREMAVAADETETEVGRRRPRARVPHSRGRRLRRGGRRPIGRFPLLPFIPPVLPAFPISEPVQDGPPGPEVSRAEPPSGEPIAPTTEPADSEPTADIQSGELPWAPPTAWTSGTVARRRRRAMSRPAMPGTGAAPQLLEQESGIVSSFSDLLRRAFGTGSPLASVLGIAQAAAAFARGERDANRLADIIFYARHQERGGRPIARGETQLAQEWLWIRDNVVQPALLRVAATTPAGTPAASQYTQRTPTLQRMALLVPLLERYRGDIPLEFLLGWIAVESDGRIDVVTNLNERGFFQIHPDESKDRPFQHERLTTDPDYSVQAGIRNVHFYANLARQRFPSIPIGSELFWRIVKLQHAMGSGLTRTLLDSMRASNIPLVWEAIKQYEVTHGPRLHPLLTVQPLGRFGRNVDGVFTRGREIARALGVP